jgi:hypothetical protein
MDGLALNHDFAAVFLSAALRMSFAKVILAKRHLNTVDKGCVFINILVCEDCLLREFFCSVLEFKEGKTLIAMLEYH